MVPALLAGIWLLLLAESTQAQFTMSGQLRTRTELRDGQGSPLADGQTPAFFTSQRTRLLMAYKAPRMRFRATLQDVRVWGQDASTNNRITRPDLNGLMLHEAWAEIDLTDTTQTHAAYTVSLKLGRQELMYDDSRLLGNLDWLQQARRHDAAVLKVEHSEFIAHAGVAYNQNREASSGRTYNGIPTGYPAGTNGIGTQYKSLQYLYLAKKLSAGNLSFLALKDDFNRYSLSETGEKVWTTGVWSRVTAGPYLSTQLGKNLTLTSSAYIQAGHDKDGHKLRASSLSISTLYNFGSRLKLGPGVDFLSGNSAGTSRSQRFDPLYGTPHKFWGQMDYFYVANGFGSGGLLNYYLNATYRLSGKVSGTVDYHIFRSPNDIAFSDAPQLNRSLGSEIDVILNYTLAPAVGIQLGYAHYFTTPTLLAAKGVTSTRTGANWAYLSLNITPQFLQSSNHY